MMFTIGWLGVAIESLELRRKEFRFRIEPLHSFPQNLEGADV